MLLFFSWSIVIMMLTNSSIGVINTFPMLIVLFLIIHDCDVHELLLVLLMHFYVDGLLPY